jgi:hypothetical protein
MCDFGIRVGPVAANKSRGAESARASSAARREQLRRQQRNRKLGFIGLWSTLVVVAAVVITLVVVQQAGSKNDTKNVNAVAPMTLTSALATVPASVFTKVGTTGFGTSVAGLKAVSGPPDLTNGKPTVTYVGGEFCPYCAAQRWVLVTGLDRFGSFTGLQTTRSAASDGNYATLTFVHAKYTSPYLAFDGKEIYDRARNKLQSLSAAANASYKKFGSVGSVPYFSINNAYVGAYQYEPQALGTTSASEIAAQIHTGKTALAKAVIASANILTAAICRQTGGKPGSVCSTPEIAAAAKVGLGAASSPTGSG